MALLRRFTLAAAAVLAATTTLVFATPQTAPQRPPASADLAQKLPVDPEVTTGTFANGLRYYIRQNRLPEKRAELRLVVNVGSLMEEDDQQGLAHFVEHMAFNGTKNFPKSDIVTFMESIGMRFGPSVNAFTSFDETVYMLQIPTEKPEIVDRSLLILEDWAHSLSFDPAEIDKERGVIMEEWRLRRGAAARMQDQQFPVLLKGSRYADRLPIGKTEVIQGFKHDRLKQFYADWYRPDLMAVIAVGDFDKAAMQGLIQKHFASLPRAAKPRPRPAYDVPKQPGTLYTVATDPEAPMTQVSVYSKMAFRDPSTVGAYRTQIVERLFGSMLSARFAEIAQKPNAPFMNAGTYRGLFVKAAEASTLVAMAKDGQVAPTLEAMFTETERVNKFGFTQTELDREKTSMLRGLTQALAEKDKRQSVMLANEYVRNFTQAEPFPGLQNEVELTERVLPGISLAEVNGLAREWMPEGNRVVVVERAAETGRAGARRGGDGRCHQGRGEQAHHRVRGHDDGKDFVFRGAKSRRGDEDERPRRCRHYRVDAVQRREGDPQADNPQSRRDSLPCLQSRRDVAGGRRWADLGGAGSGPDFEQRAGFVLEDRARQDARRQDCERRDRTLARSTRV